MGDQLAPHHTNVCKISRLDLAELYLELVSFQKLIFRLGNFTDLKAFFPEVLTDFPSQNHGRVSVLLQTIIVLLPRENKLILSYSYPQRIANCGYIHTYIHTYIYLIKQVKLHKMAAKG